MYVRVMHACVEMVWVAMVMIVAISKKDVGATASVNVDTQSNGLVD